MSALSVQTKTPFQFADIILAAKATLSSKLIGYKKIQKKDTQFINFQEKVYLKNIKTCIIFRIFLISQ